MKEQYKVEYTMNGKPSFAYVEASSEEEAMKILKKELPGAVPTSASVNTEPAEDADDGTEDPVSAATN